MSLPVDFSPLLFRAGYSIYAKPDIAIPDPYGVVEIRVKEVERIEVYLGGEEGYREAESGNKGKQSVIKGNGETEDISSRVSSDISRVLRWDNLDLLNSFEEKQAVTERKGSFYYGYLVVGEKLRPLPIGSTLDSERGIFYWQPGPGFLGPYDFVFIKECASGLSTKILLRVIINHKF